MIRHPIRALPLLLLCSVAAPLAGQGQPTFTTPPELPPTRGYSQVVDIPSGSHLIILSGQVPLDSTGQLVGGTDFRAQAVQVFENLRRALTSRGAGFTDVVKFTFYIRDVQQNLAIVREVRDRYINAAAPPASTLVEVSGLFRPDVLLEVEAMAAVPRQQ